MGVMHYGEIMTDWEIFCEDVPWFLSKDAKVSISEESPRFVFSSEVEQQLPLLTKLLQCSSVTRININGVEHDLLSWNSLDGYRMGWLTLAPNRITNKAEIVGLHEQLLACFGGVIERFNEPEQTWLLNTNDFLTIKEASNDAAFIEDYDWAFEDEGVQIPIDPEEFYCVLREVNGNTTICHKKTGRIILFAADHSFDHITPMKGCPEYTLYDITGSENFITWVESIAQQWLDEIA